MPRSRHRHPLDHLALTPAERRRSLVRLLAEVVLRLQGVGETAPPRHLEQAEDGPGAAEGRPSPPGRHPTRSPPGASRASRG